MIILPIIPLLFLFTSCRGPDKQQRPAVCLEHHTTVQTQIGAQAEQHQFTSTRDPENDTQT